MVVVVLKIQDRDEDTPHADSAPLISAKMASALVSHGSIRLDGDDVRVA